MKRTTTTTVTEENNWEWVIGVSVVAAFTLLWKVMDSAIDLLAVLLSFISDMWPLLLIICVGVLIWPRMSRKEQYTPYIEIQERETAPQRRKTLPQRITTDHNETTTLYNEYETRRNAMRCELNAGTTDHNGNTTGI